MVRYTAEIDGRPVVSEYVHNSPGDALSGAKSRFDKTIRNRYDLSSRDNVDSIIGSATREDDTARAFEEANRTTPKPRFRSRPARAFRALSETIAGDNLTSDEAADLERERVKAENKAETEAGVMIKGQPKNHVPFQNVQNNKEDLYDGYGGRQLKEPHPKYFERKGDKIYENSNNARIVLGRDFRPSNDLLYSKNSTDRVLNSGYSDHMGAGAIDIVVGLMAPFPLENIGKDYSKEAADDDADSPIIRDIIVAPSFNIASRQRYKIQNYTMVLTLVWLWMPPST